MSPLEARLGLKRGASLGLKVLWGGETSRYHGRFRTVFYRSEGVVCDFKCSFGCDVRCCSCYADVHFVLFFTDQDAPPALPARGVFSVLEG